MTGSNSLKFYSAKLHMVLICQFFTTNVFKPGARWPAPVRAWFLEIVSVQTSVCVFVCVCPPPRLLITSGVMWRDMDPMRLVKQVL